MGLVIHVDGGSRGNPGPAGAGVVIRTESGERVHEGGYFLGSQTNNAAEYHALIRALQRAAELGATALAIRSDSELLVRQITGEYRVKSATLQPLFEQAQMLLLRVPLWNLQHVRREQNTRADQLANQAMDEGHDVIVFDADDAAPTPARESAGDGPSPPARVVDPDGAPSESGPRQLEAARPVRVSLARTPSARECPAGAWSADAFTVRETLPTGLCVYAAHALVPTILAVQNTDPEEFAAVPTLTVRCMRPGCTAVFHVSPQRSTNGKAARDEPA